MAPWRCPNCKREFAKNTLLKRHLERKTACSPDEYDQCVKCNKQFYMKKEYLEHVRACNGEEFEALTRSNVEPVVLKKIEEFTKEELYEEYLRARGYGRKCFECEDDSFLMDITVDEVKDCVSLDMDCRGVIDMFVMTNMNSKLPDNHNVRCNDDHFEILRKKGWRRIDQDDLAYRVLLKNRLRFYDIETQLTEILGEDGFGVFDKKLDEIETMVHEKGKGPEFQALKERLFDVLTSAQQPFLLMTDERKNLHDQLDTLLASQVNKSDVETALKRLLADHSEKSSEPILQESENRYVLLPIKYPDVWELYQKAVASFWVPNEVDLKSDVEDWESKLNSNEREFIKNVLAFFAASDFIVNENLVERFSSEIMIPEAKCFYAFQSAMESIHCVAPETRILTSDGYFRIDKLVDMAVDVWNGHEFSEVYVKKTSENAKVLCVKLSNGMQLQCTTEHKWFVFDGQGRTVKVHTKDLRAGTVLAPYKFPPTMNSKDGPHHVDGYDLPKHVPINYSVQTKIHYLCQLVDLLSPTFGGALIRSKDVKLLWDVQLLLTTLEVVSSVHDGGLFVGRGGLDRLNTLGFEPRMEPADMDEHACVYVVDVEDSGRHCATYCFNEPQRHAGCFNGIVTGQSETYALLLDTFIKNPKEKHEALNAITTIPCIKKKADWARKWTADKDSTFAKRLVAFAIVEGVHFSGSFCALFWLRKRNLMKGLTFSNSLIARDEGLHTDHACLLYTHLRNRLSDEEAHTIMKEAVDIEKEFICDSLKVSLLGMNNLSMSQYIEFVADRLLSQLGHPKMFKTRNPFDWMNMTALYSKSSFFETRASEYSKANVGLSASEMEFGMDEEF